MWLLSMLVYALCNPQSTVSYLLEQATLRRLFWQPLKVLTV